MPVVAFQGKVEPSASPLDFEFVPEVEVFLSAISLRMKSRIEITKSAVRVTCELDRWSDDLASWVLNYVTIWSTRN